MNQSRGTKSCDIVMTVHNDWHLARPCIDSVLNHPGAKLRKLILVDHSSDPFVSEKLKRIMLFHRGLVLVISNPKPFGFVRSCNIGIKASQARYIVILSPDTLVTSGWLERLLSPFALDNHVGMACPISNSATHTQIPMLPGYDIHRMSRLINEKTNRSFLDIPAAEDFCLAVSRKCLSEIGFLDEIFENADLAMKDYSQRAKYFGFRIVCAIDTYIFHKEHRATPVDNTDHSAEKEIYERRWKNRLSTIYPKTNLGKLEELRNSLSQVDHNAPTAKTSGHSSSENASHFFCILPTLNPYGGVISVVNLMNHLIELGHNCTMVSLSRCDTHPHTLYFQPIFIEKWEEIPTKMADDYDVLIATSWETVGPVVELTKKTQKKTAVYFVQGLESVFYKEHDPRHHAVGKTYSQIATKIVKTKYLESKLWKLGWRTRRIRPGLNLDLFYPRQKKESSRLRILSMIRVGHRYRGDDIAIALLEKLSQIRDDIEIVLFGSDGLENLTVNFSFINKGFVSPNHLPAIYSQSDVYIDMSREHGFGRTGVEAMACGAACILSDCGGIREYARHNENALIVPVGDLNSAVDQTSRLLDDRDLRARLVKEGLKTVQKIDDRAAARDFLDIIHEKVCPQIAPVEGLTLNNRIEEAHSLTLGEKARVEFIKRNPLRRILVNSIPKSGTTWVRTMLVSLPGYQLYPMDGLTGTSPEQLLDVQPGQVFHGHIMSSDHLDAILQEMDFATVFVYRDLRDVVISNYFHYFSLNPKRAPDFFKGKEKEILLDSDNLLEWCPPCKRYPDIRVWISNNSIPCATYEALKTDTVQEIKKVLKQMGFWINDEIVEYIVNQASFENLSGRVPGDENPHSPQRKGVIGDWKNHFSERNKKKFKKKYGDLLIEFGFEKDMNW